MNNLKKWYSVDKEMEKNFLWLNIDLYKEMYWSLSDDKNNPFSRISVANSSFSLDPTRWCPLNCAYCVTLSNKRDLNSSKIEEVIVDKDYRKLFSKNIEVLFDWDVLVENLNNFEWFIPNKSVISISTWSSDPFLKENQIQMWKIFWKLIDLWLKNPIWIVTKYWIPASDINENIKQFKKIVNNWNKVILSISSWWAPTFVEPYTWNRFSWMIELKSIWVHISHHLRPIIRGINDTKEVIEKVLKESIYFVDSICIWWLRLDPSIILTWKYINKLDTKMLPSKSWEKDMPDNIFSIVEEILIENNKKIPIFKKSSDVISNHIWRSYNYNLSFLKDKNNKNLSYLITVNDNLEKNILNYTWISVIDNIIKIADSIWIKNLKVYKKNNDYYSNINLNYQWNRLLTHAIGFSDIF